MLLIRKTLNFSRFTDQMIIDIGENTGKAVVGGPAMARLVLGHAKNFSDVAIVACFTYPIG